QDLDPHHTTADEHVERDLRRPITEFVGIAADGSRHLIHYATDRRDAEAGSRHTNPLNGRFTPSKRKRPARVTRRQSPCCSKYRASAVLLTPIEAETAVSNLHPTPSGSP